MKRQINTLQDTLVFQLQGLYFAEKKIAETFRDCSFLITSASLKRTTSRYVDESAVKILKLEKIFNYLMQEPECRKNKVIVKMIDEAEEMLSFTDSPHLKDILLVSCLQNLNAYKISSLKIAYMFTVELEMDTASDLIQQILERELETGKALSVLAIEEFNKNSEVMYA